MKQILRIGSARLEKGRPCLVAVWSDRVPQRRLVQARDQYDLLEWRADLCASAVPEKLLSRVRDTGHGPRLLTIRSAREGGAWRGTDRDRLRLYKALLPAVQAVDVELSSRSILDGVVTAAKRSDKKIIVSCHDFKRTPELPRLTQILRSARAAGADIVKIAAWVRRPEDVRVLAQLLCGSREPLVVIGMGPQGIVTRMLFPALGSLLTYASLDARPAAPGQFDCRTADGLLRQLYPRYGSR